MGKMRNSILSIALHTHCFCSQFTFELLGS
uniref:Uncharacterized protein n=1 Tax=Anguilla anguilla TaxID=7936 RepID=A0A0E9XGB7_ANGAN